MSGFSFISALCGLAVLLACAPTASLSPTEAEALDVESGMEIASQDLERGLVYLYDLRYVAPDSYVSDQVLETYGFPNCSGGVPECLGLERLSDIEGFERCLAADYPEAVNLLGRYDKTVGRARPYVVTCGLFEDKTYTYAIQTIIESTATHSVAYYHGFNLRMLQEFAQSGGRLTTP